MVLLASTTALNSNIPGARHWPVYRLMVRV